MRESIKKLITFVIAIAFVCVAFISAISFNESNKNKAYAANGDKVIILQIDNQQITIDGENQEIDASPVIISGRTLVPIRAIIEAMGGSVDWNSELKETTLKYNNDTLKLTIDSKEAFLNDKKEILDTAPAVISSRTMLPIRFIAESFGFHVIWNAETQNITISNGESTSNDNKDVTTADNTTPVVYMTKNISPESLVAIYNKLGFEE